MKIMRRFIILCAAITLCMPIMAHETIENYVQVNGIAEKEVTPNQFYLTITLDTSVTKGKQEIDAQRRAMIDALKGVGVQTDKALRVADMSSSYFKRNTTLTAVKYQLYLTDAESVAKVYEALSDIAIANIKITKVSHSDLEQLRSQVRKEAILNAKKTATELAEAVGQSIGECFYIYDSNYNMGETRFVGSTAALRAYKNSGDTAEEEEVIEFKKIKLSYSVNAKFRLL